MLKQAELTEEYFSNPLFCSLPDSILGRKERRVGKKIAIRRNWFETRAVRSLADLDAEFYCQFFEAS